MPTDINFPHKVDRWIAVETIPNDPHEPTVAKIRVRPLPGQNVPTTVRVECSRRIRDQYPIGTVFAMRANISDREGTPFLYSYFGWATYVIDRKTAEAMIARKELGFFQEAWRDWRL